MCPLGQVKGMGLLHAPWRSARPSSHSSFWAGMLLKTIFSQGKTEMKMPLGKSRGPLPTDNWSSVLAPRTTLVSSSRKEASIWSAFLCL